MQRTPSSVVSSRPVTSPKTPTGSRSGQKTPSRSPSFCSRLQEALKSPGNDDDVKMVQSDLDNKVRDIAGQTQGLCLCKEKKCPKKHIKKVADGKYEILGKSVFVRLLKGKHVMVRVGGGWDTLEHYLLRHDPTQVKIFKARTKFESSFLQIKGRYRSPTPSEKSTKTSEGTSISSSTNVSESDRARKDDEDSLSRQSTPTEMAEKSSLYGSQSAISESITMERTSEMESHDLDGKTPEEKDSNNSVSDTGMEEVSSAFFSLESKILSDQSNHHGSLSNVDGTGKMVQGPCHSSHRHDSDDMGSCDLLSAPVGENGDFCAPASLSSGQMDAIMMSSCPSLDIADSSASFTTVKEIPKDSSEEVQWTSETDTQSETDYFNLESF